MMKSSNLIRPIAGGVAAALVTLPAFAGTEPLVLPPVHSEESNNGSFCEWLSDSPGTLFKDKENPWIQKVKIFGRAHYQAAYVDGDEGSELIQDFRRLRAGAQVDFLQYFSAKAEFNFASDRRRSGGDLDFGYQDFEVATLAFNLGKALDLQVVDEAKLIFGKQKIEVGSEQHLSSKKIKTIERSAIANRVRPGNSTGLALAVEKDNWAATVGYYSNEQRRFISDDFNTNSKGFFYASATYGFDNGDSFTADYVDNTGDTDGATGFDWVAAASYNIERDYYSVSFDAFYGDSGAEGDRGGEFYGIVILPTYWVVKDKVELVARYQWQGSNESQGVRSNSRYARADGFSGASQIEDSGRGDSHHSIYAGLNYYFCGDNAEVLFGAQYDNVDVVDGHTAEAVTYGAAFRVFF